MRIEVYHDETLAAVFQYGRHPSYYGARGRQVRALVQRPHSVRNLWTGETALAPPDDSVPWWAANIFRAGLREAGYTVTFWLVVTAAASGPLAAPAAVVPRRRATRTRQQRALSRLPSRAQASSGRTPVAALSAG